MEFEEYLLKEVGPGEFEELKRQEKDIVDAVMRGFNDHWKPKVQGIHATFRYNPKRNVIGIYLERDGEKQLIVEGDRISREEVAVVGSLYLNLEKRLSRLRLPKEQWVDSIQK